LTRFHESCDYVATKEIPMAKESTNQDVPVKTALFQITMRPPEAPTDGAKTNLSKRLGQKVLIKAGSKDSRLVSWIHSTEQPLVSIAFLIAKSFASEFMPLMFHESTFHDLFIGREDFSLHPLPTSAGHPVASHGRGLQGQFHNCFPSVEDLQSVLEGGKQ